MKTLRPLILLVLLALSVSAGATDLSRAAVLVAKPALQDPVYGSSVLMVVPLGDDQHVGFIVNRPTRTHLGELFPEHAPSRKIVDPVYLGGPVASEVIFAMVRQSAAPGAEALALMPGLFVAYGAAEVDRIIESGNPRTRFIAGLVAWRAGELSAEIEQGAWYVLEPDAALLERQPEGLWQELVQRAQRPRWTL